MADAKKNPPAAKKGGTVRQPAFKIFAARRICNTDEKSASAAICIGAQLRLTVLDYYTGLPIKGALLKRVDVEHYKDSHGALATVDQDFFDLPFPVPEYAPSFTPADEKVLKKTLEVLEDADAKKIPVLTAQRDALIDKRQNRLVWARWVQCAVKIIMAWRSDKTYDGPVDGSDWVNFESKYLADVYRGVTGKKYADANASYKVVAQALYDSIAGWFTTDDEGVVSIPLPVEHTGSVTLEFRHLKIHDPADFAKLTPLEKVRAEYDYKHGDYDADAPGSTVEVSRWKLTCPKATAPLRNWIKLSYDTTGPKALKPIEHSTYAMLWCQPTWFQTPDKGFLPEPDSGIDPLKQGQHQGRPTFCVSASFTERGRWYGSYGERGRSHGSVNWDEQVIEHPDKPGTWCWMKPEPEPIPIIEAYDKDTKELRKKLTTDYPRRFEQLQRRIRENKAILTFSDGTFGDPKKDAKYSKVLEWYRSPIEHASEGEALAAAASFASDGKRLLKQDDDKKWYISRPADFYHRFGKSAAYDDPRDTLDKEFAWKMHHGIDCACDVGDPCFAVCGGTVAPSGKETYNDSASAGGLVVNLTPWRREAASFYQYLHLAHTPVKKGDVVKAGDAMAVVGRTGNPVSDSPTHTHFHGYKVHSADTQSRNTDLSFCILPSHISLVPFNGQPKLLPCAADWYQNSPNKSTPPKPDTGTDTPKHCRAMEPSNKGNVIPNSCWAMKEGRCPHMTPAQWKVTLDKDAAEKKAAEKK